MRLKSSDPESDSDIAVLSTDEFVDGLQLGGIISQTFGKLTRFRANRRGGFDPIFLQIPVPASNFVPCLETADLDVRKREMTKSRIGRFLLVIIFFDVVRSGVGPSVDARTAFGGYALCCGWTFNLYCSVGGNFDFDSFVEHNAVALEVILEPELPRYQRLRRPPTH